MAKGARGIWNRPSHQLFLSLVPEFLLSYLMCWCSILVYHSSVLDSWIYALHLPISSNFFPFLVGKLDALFLY
jgi:hypothetical protein